MNNLIFKPVTGKEFLQKAIIESDKMTDLDELGYYLIVNDSFFIIQECSVTPGAVEVRNCYNDVHYTVEMDEEGMIYQMTNFDEDFKS